MRPTLRQLACIAGAAFPLVASAARVCAAQQAAWAPRPGLVGIVQPEPGGTRAGALITCDTGSSAGSARLVLLGDSVCGAQLVDVHSDRVTLTQDGSAIELRLPEGEPSPHTVAPVARLDAPGAAPPTVRIADDSVHVQLSSAALDAYLADLPSLLAAASVVPHLQDGPDGRRPDGFELTAVQPGSIVARLGIVPGDIVVDVNGAPFHDPATLLRLLADLKAARHATVGVRRHSERLLFVLDIE